MVQPSKTSITITLPVGCEPYVNDIRRFVNAMVYKLGINAHKGRWETLNLQGEYDKMLTEVEELRLAMEGRNTVDILLEAADVANFALIIASKELDGDK